MPLPEPIKDRETFESVRLSRRVRRGITMATISLTIGLFESGWINLWNKRAIPNNPLVDHPTVWGQSFVWSIPLGAALGCLLAWGIIWEIEILATRRKRKKGDKGSPQN